MTEDSTAAVELDEAPPIPDVARPSPPVILEDTGLSTGMISDLIVKTLYSAGSRTGEELRESVCLNFAILDEQLLTLQQRQMVEVRGASGQSRATYTFDLTTAGRNRAREAFEQSGYVGPAPVPLDRYRRWVEMQTVRSVHVTTERIREGFSHLVFDESFLDQLGPAINSGKSLFLYGHSGNGKTTIAEAIAGMLGGAVFLPHAVEVDGQIIVLYDPVFHHPVDDVTPPDEMTEGTPLFREEPKHDRRYAFIRRPVVFVGGELALEQLELQYDHHTRIYQAPAHVKANGGVFIIDDFGRQLVRPRDLLNRWMVPLEKNVDFLAFRTGYKVPVPFDAMILFATNLNPLELVDEAFLRRIRYKILVESPSYEQYEEIFRRCCENNDILYEPARVKYIFQQYYDRLQIPPRGCHPRDVVDTVCNVAKYMGLQPSLSTDLLDRACRAYFLDMPGGGTLRGGYLVGDDE
jgi:predicted ATPase with chaperone activity